MWESPDLGEVIRKITGKEETQAKPFGKKTKAATKEDANETEPDATE
jgi:hypothetical protein